MEKFEMSDWYFKQGEGLISGRSLPTDKDGVVRNKRFINCDFHPNCGTIQFEDCGFERCNGLHYLEKRKNCITHGLSSFMG